MICQKSYNNGETNGRYSHGMSYTKTYRSWAAMKRRCNSKKMFAYHRYGGRGITYDPRWEKFENFYEDMGDMPKGLTLDRIDNDGNYCKENCAWRSRRDQANNTKRNKFLEYKGKKQTFAQWEREMGFCRSSISYRIKRGWSVERTLAILNPNKT